MHHPIRKQLAELKFIFTGYPEFVYSTNDNQSLNGIPVFIYHTIDPKVFESHLVFLKENNYRALSIHEFYNSLTSKEPVENKSVLITIDDARSSVWRFAYPLLKKYQMNAVLFVVPGLTPDDLPCRNNLEDAWNKKLKIEKLTEIDSGDDTLCNWNEIIEMYKSGLVNIESHTLFHREIFKNSLITDFITPDKNFLPYDFTGSPYFPYMDSDNLLSGEHFLGMPLFETAPLMMAGPKLDISIEFMDKCRDIYKSGNRHSKDWKNKIKALVKDSSSVKKYFDFKLQSEKDVLEDLNKAREIIQKKLDKNAGNHLCLPWTLGNDITIKILKNLEIKSCFWGILPDKKINKYGDDPYYISRIKNDFVFRLPGQSRKSLFSIYRYKLKRRLNKEKVF